MPQKTEEGKLLPKTKYERFLKLQAQIYAIRLLELKDKVCARDRATVEKAFTSASLEATSLVPDHIDYDEQRYRAKNQKAFKSLESA